MYIISEETVLRANQRMMECKVERDDVDFVSPNICVSVIANGRVYKQEVTDKEMRKAFKKALRDNSAIASINGTSSTLLQTKKSRVQAILGKMGQLKSKSIKHSSHAPGI